MATDKYTYNQQEQRYEIHRTSLGRRFGDAGIMVLIGIVLLVAYLLLNGKVFHTRTPKEMVLESRNARLIDRIEYIGQKASRQVDKLAELEMRDNKVYRPIFGMDEIPSAVRNAGYVSPGRYDFLSRFKNSGFLSETLRRQDVIEKKAVMQSKSYDDVEKMATHIEDMAKCVPSLFPVCPSGAISITSPFGYRLHPIFQSVFFHSGTDIAGPRATPVYATADGVVSEVKHSDRGYGNEVNIDHGFGYSTRYAHLLSTNVAPGQKINRGDQLGTMGSSGRATGVHLHYEVLYQSQQVNPRNFFDEKIDAKTYMTQVRPAEKLSGK